MVRKEFAKNRHVEDQQQIEALQSHAVRALSNYLLFQSAGNDPKVKKAFKSFHDKHVKEASVSSKEKQSNEQSTNPTRIEK